MNDESKNNHMMPKCGVAGHMSRTFSQPGLEFQLRKQRLNDHQACKRREPLVFESKLRNFVDTTGDLCFTIPHYQWPPGSVDFDLLLVTSILTNQEAVLRRFVATIYDYFMQQEG
jgi:hypothetical protein